MSQLAHEFPEEYARIAALPPAQQNAAERELATRLLARPELQHEHVGESPPTMTKNCRNCGDEIKVLAENAGSGSKWFNLCWSCLRDEM